MSTVQKIVRETETLRDLPWSGRLKCTTKQEDMLLLNQVNEIVLRRHRFNRTE